MASGDTLLILTPLANEFGDANYATLDLRNNHPVLDFNDGTVEYAYFSGILPSNYSGNGLTIVIWFAMSSAVSGDVYWEAAIERIGEVLDIDSDSFAAVQSDIETVAGISGICAKAEISISDGAQMDGLVVGEAFRLMIKRLANDGSDTASGDAELLAIEVKES